MNWDFFAVYSTSLPRGGRVRLLSSGASPVCRDRMCSARIVHHREQCVGTSLPDVRDWIVVAHGGHPDAVRDTNRPKRLLSPPSAIADWPTVSRLLMASGSKRSACQPWLSTKSHDGCHGAAQYLCTAWPPGPGRLGWCSERVVPATSLGTAGTFIVIVVHVVRVSPSSKPSSASSFS